MEPTKARFYPVKAVRWTAAAVVRSALVAAALAAGPAAAAQEGSTVLVRIETELGAIVVELYPDRAPITVSNFLRYVDGGHYRGGSFYRTVRPDNQAANPVPIAVIQADVHPWRRSDSFPPIPLERTGRTGLRHVDGALSMARTTPDTATSSFFICVGDQPDLDEGGRRNPDGQGFAAFGRVVEGMDVVRRIQTAPAEGEAIMPPVRIVGVTRVDGAAADR